MDNRIDFDRYFLNIAADVSKRSTCIRRQYGSVIVKDKRIVSTGYNGSPAGEPNCCDVGFCLRERLNIPRGERYEICLHGDTIIKCLDGYNKTIEELYNIGNEFWTYSFDTNTGMIVPSVASAPFITDFVDTLISIQFNSGTPLLCTRNHRVLMRDGTYKKACNINIGDSVVPMYYNYSKNNGVESISNTSKMRINGRWNRKHVGVLSNSPTHRIVYEYFNGEIPDGYVVHHIDGNHNNNIPSNLQLLKIGEHSKLHNTGKKIRDNVKAKLSLSMKKRWGLMSDIDIQQHSIRARNSMNNNWNNDNFKEMMKNIQIANGKMIADKYNSDENAIYSRRIGFAVKGLKKVIDNYNGSVDEYNYNDIRKLFTVAHKSGERGSQPPTMDKIIALFGSFENAIEYAKNYNHTVVGISVINYNELIPVYDLSVGIFQNFAIDIGDNSGVFVHNCTAVHGEANAIIFASFNDLIDSTIYIAGYQNGKRLYNTPPCKMCNRLIKNARIKNVIYETEEGIIVSYNPVDLPEY